MNLPVDFTSTYSYAPGAGHGPAPSQLEEGLDADSALGGSSEGQAAPDYAREGVPSWVPLEDLLAELEAAPGTQASGLLFSSGMAALSAVVHLMRPGG
ncbi:MAG TPA: PLP-dependent transferase, partial [Candidatus Nesterenkonia stercoripullorum]|nr:PLP-dependent transferase [Candidatus Nesterenkonia stercoripullorum]